MVCNPCPDRALRGNSLNYHYSITMFCVNCGKQIADDSTFCEFCGAKLVKEEISKEVNALSSNPENDIKEGTQVEKTKEIKNKELKQMADHLEFLRYEIEKLDIEGELEWVAARHSVHNNYVFHEITPYFVLFQSGIKLEKEYTSAMAESINVINKVLNITKVYYEVLDDFPVLRIEAVYVGEYSKEKFARFQDLYEKDQTSMTQLEDFKVFFKD